MSETSPKTEPPRPRAEEVLDHYDALVTDALDKAAPKLLRDYLGAQADLIDDMRQYLVSGIPAGPSDAERVEAAHQRMHRHPAVIGLRGSDCVGRACPWLSIAYVALDVPNPTDSQTDAGRQS